MKTRFILILTFGFALCFIIDTKTTFGQGVETVISKELAAYEGMSYKAINSVTLKPGFEFAASEDFSFSIIIGDGNEVKLSMEEIQSTNKTITEYMKFPGVTTDSQINSLGINQKKTSITYWDGLRRVIQVVDKNSSPTNKDMVQPISYDKFGQQSIKYLPYISQNTTGDFTPGAIMEQAAFYNTVGTNIASDAKAFAETKYDSSPLGVIIEQGAVGADWQLGTNHTIKSNYRVNISGDNVIKWDVLGPGENYAEQELAVSETVNQNGNKIITFSDKNGQLLLKKIQLDENITEGGNTEFVGYLETYYVYDDFGNLIYQVPPKAVSKLKGGATWSNSFIDEWVFKYTYDEYKRLIEKKVPGSGAVYMVYDQLNRPVMVQDANNRSTNKWFFTKYDASQRPILQGMYVYTELYSGSSLSPREQLQKFYNELNYDVSGTFHYEKRQSGTVHGYSNAVFPTNSIELMMVNYFDDYDFNYDGIADHSYIQPDLQGAATSAHLHIDGILTGSKKRILGSSTWLTSVVFYDEYGRSIQKQSNNQLYSLGLNDIQSVVYDGFSSVPKLTKQVKSTSATVKIVVNNRYEYDHSDRLIQVYQAHNGLGEQLIGQYAYNEIGQLVDKSLHAKNGGGFLQSIDYRYNIRGWLTRINNSSLTIEADDNGVNDLFGLEIQYNTEVTGLTTNADTRFDGMISSVKWKTNDIHSSSTSLIQEKSYKFAYDKTGRLKDALYSAFDGTSWTLENGGYDERGIKYDHNGNILSLKRYSIDNGSNTPSLIDDLTYVYNSGSGNQLKQVEDASANSQGFKESVHVGDEYIYDLNGNLVSDKNKGDGITALNITYNELNKTSRVDLPGERYILYTYAATGERLRKEVHDNNSVKTIDYIEGFVYENTVLSYFSMAEGRIRNTGETLKYEYFIKDHQGNVRVSFEEGSNGLAKIVQENHYYPFGLAMKGAIIRTALPSNPNKNLYNGGSEHQDDFGEDPNWYSTFFREYDAVLGRFHAVDPLADKFGYLSPYNYAGNNPIMFNDPLGDTSRSWQDILNELWKSDYGGSWDGQGDPVYFSSQEDAFGWGANYITKYDTWGETEAGSYEAAAQTFNMFASFEFGGAKGYVDTYNPQEVIMVWFRNRDSDGKVIGNSVVNGISGMAMNVNATEITAKGKESEKKTTDSGFEVQDTAYAMYLLNTVTTLYNEHAVRNIGAIETQGAYWKKLTGKHSKSVKRALEANKFTKIITESAGKKLFGVGVVLSIGSVISNPSAGNIALNVLDTGMGYAAMTIPGMQIPALIYFTGRIAYDVYDAYNNP